MENAEPTTATETTPLDEGEIQEPSRGGRGRQAQSAGDDRLEILRMVESRIISAEEANRLLDALDRFNRFERTEYIAPPPVPPAPPAQPRHVRVRITEDEEPRVNLVLPIGLVDAGMKIVKRYTGDNLLDANEIQKSAQTGFRGTLLDIQDDSQHIEIIVE